MWVDGRLDHSEHSYSSNHPIILHKHSPITRLLALQVHTDVIHVGFHTMLSILVEDYYIVGVKSLLRQISKNCVICQMVYSHVPAPGMGLLPMERVKPSPPFAVTGLDYAGPLLIRCDHACRLSPINTPACLPASPPEPFTSSLNS